MLYIHSELLISWSWETPICSEAYKMVLHQNWCCGKVSVCLWLLHHTTVWLHSLTSFHWDWMLINLSVVAGIVWFWIQYALLRCREFLLKLLRIGRTELFAQYTWILTGLLWGHIVTLVVGARVVGLLCLLNDYMDSMQLGDSTHDP